MTRTVPEILPALRAAVETFRVVDHTDRAAWLAASAAVDSLRDELYAAVEKPATLPLRIAGETRQVAVTWYRDRAFSVENVGMARVSAGGKLWPMGAIFFVSDKDGSISGGQTRERVLGRTCTFVSWIDAKIADRAISASLHAAGTKGAETREKAAATKKSRRGK
jgi:hypothetical protein